MRQQTRLWFAAEQACRFVRKAAATSGAAKTSKRMSFAWEAPVVRLELERGMLDTAVLFAADERAAQGTLPLPFRCGK